MATHTSWSAGLHQESNPGFYSDAQAVEMPEVSWHDAETLATEDDEHVSETQLEAIEEVEEQQPAPRSPRFRDAHDHRMRMWQEHDARMDEKFAQSKGKVEYKDRFQAAFHKVVDQRNHFLNRSAARVQQYSDSGSSARKAGAANRIDFIVDAELVAKRTLKDSPELWSVFQKQILENEAEMWQAVPVELRNQIEQKVGRAYIRVGLHPTSRYFA
jgi:hypothetical protein